MTDPLLENLKRPKWELKYSKYAHMWWVFNPNLDTHYYFTTFGEAHDYLTRMSKIGISATYGNLKGGDNND